MTMNSIGILQGTLKAATDLNPYVPRRLDRVRVGDGAHRRRRRHRRPGRRILALQQVPSPQTLQDTAHCEQLGSLPSPPLLLLGVARKGTAEPGATGLRTAWKQTKSPAAPRRCRCRRDACGCRWQRFVEGDDGTWQAARRADCVRACVREESGDSERASLPICGDHDRTRPIQRSSEAQGWTAGQHGRAAPPSRSPPPGFPGPE
jgi:hypothetical protein